MKLSYLYQAVNLSASALLLVAVVGHLDSALYLQWLLFQTIAGALVQLEQSLSAIATRHLSREQATGDQTRLAMAITATRNAYQRFSLIGVGTMFACGLAYLAWAGNSRFSAAWPIEWGLFCLGYLLWYSNTHAACLLIALNRADMFSGVALATRLVNASLSLVLLFAGYAIMGLSISALTSFAGGAMAFAVAARRLRPVGPVPKTQMVDYPGFRLRDIVSHASYVLLAYLVYRSGLVVSAGLAEDSTVQASFGLALQILTLTVAVATVPLQMRVSPLVEAITQGDTAAARRELVILAAYVNLAFWSAMVALIALAQPLQAFIPTRGAVLPDTGDLALLALAYGVELNLFVFVNALLAARRFRFVTIYAMSVSIAMTAALFAWLLGVDFYIAFVLLPTIIQITVAAPMIIRLLHVEIDFSVRDHVAGVIRHIGTIVRHPISVGLTFQ